LSRIIDITQGANVICLPVQSRWLVEEPVGEYETEQNPIETTFEKSRLITTKKNLLPEAPADCASLLRDFVDGELRIFRFTDVVKDKRYYPVVAGQVALGVLERVYEKLVPLRDIISFEHVLALQDTFPHGDIKGIRKTIAENSERPFEIAT